MIEYLLFLRFLFGATETVEFELLPYQKEFLESIGVEDERTK